MPSILAELGLEEPTTLGKFPRPFQKQIETMRGVTTDVAKRLAAPYIPLLLRRPTEQQKKVDRFIARQISRPFAGIRSLVAAEEAAPTISEIAKKSFMKGFMQPETAPEMSEAVLKAYPKMPWQAAGALGTVADLGVYQLVGMLSGEAIEVVKGLSKDQQLTRLTAQIRAKPQFQSYVQKEAQSLSQKLGRQVAPDEIDNFMISTLWKGKGETPYHKIINWRSKLAQTGFARIGKGKPLPPKRIKPSILPIAKVKPVIRQVTGQFVPIEPTITEPQALKEVLRREQQVSKTASRLTKKETKETLGLIKRIKGLPIEGMKFEEKQAIETLKGELKTTRTLSSLRNLYDRLQVLKGRGKEKYLQTIQEKNEKFTLDKEILLKTIGVTPPKIPVIGPKALQPSRAFRIPKTYRATTLRPQRIFDVLDGGQNFEGANNKYFYHSVNQAEDIKLREVNRRKTAVIDAMKRIGIPERALLQTRIIDGIKFNVDEMISLYAGAKNKEKTLALVYGNKIPFSTIRNVIAQMTPQEKALGDVIIRDYEGNYDKLRKAFIEYTDGKQDLGKVEGGYTPIKRTMNGYIPTENELADEMLTRANLKKAYAQRGFTKERLKIPAEYQQPIRLGELSLWNEQMRKQEHFVAYGNLVKELQKMVNDKDFSIAVKSKLGEQYVEVIKNWVNRVANPSIYKAYSQLDKSVATLRQNAAIAYLGLNLVTMLKQGPSVALFLEDVSVPELMGGIYDLTTDYKNKIALIHKLSPQMKNRSIERELEELKNSDPNRYRQILKRFGEKAMFGIYEIDKLVTHSGWLGIYNKFTRAGLSEEEAANRATRAVLRTQPAAHAKDLADIYATNEAYNILLQFTNQLNQIYNIITYDIPTQAKTGRYRDAMRTAFGVSLSAYLIAWMMNGRPPLTRKNLTDSGIEQGLAYIPLFGRGIQAMRKGFDFISIPAFSGVRAMGRTLGYLEKGKFPRALETGVESAAVLGGIPFAQPRKVIRGLRDLVTGETKDLRRLLYSEYILKGKKKKKRSILKELGLGTRKRSILKELGL